MFFEWAMNGATVGVEILFAIVTLLAGAGAVLSVVAILTRIFGAGGNEDGVRRD